MIWHNKQEDRHGTQTTRQTRTGWFIVRSCIDAFMSPQLIRSINIHITTRGITHETGNFRAEVLEVHWVELGQKQGHRSFFGCGMSMHPKCKPANRNRHERSLQPWLTGKRKWLSWPHGMPCLKLLQPLVIWTGKILLDCTNPLVGNQLDAALNSTHQVNKLQLGSQMQKWKFLIKLVGKQWQIRNMAWSLPLCFMRRWYLRQANCCKIGIRSIGFEPIDAEHQCPSFRNTCYLLGQPAYGQGIGRNIAWRLFAA